jgi:hypothetical protein
MDLLKLHRRIEYDRLERIGVMVELILNEPVRERLKRLRESDAYVEGLFCILFESFSLTCKGSNLFVPILELNYLAMGT